MAIGLHGAISWFQKKIGTYDKTNWEITVENQEMSQVLTDKLSVAKLPTDLLDLDLIRGSTFTKAKPGYHWTQVREVNLGHSCWIFEKLGLLQCMHKQLNFLRPMFPQPCNFPDSC